MVTTSRRRMKTTQKTTAIVLVLLLGATVYGLIRTTESPKLGSLQGQGKTPATAQAALIDQSPLKTAQDLARLATTSEEQPLAQEVLRVADYEVDLAFAQALHDVTEHPPALSQEAKQIQAQLQKAQKILETDKSRVEQLTAAEAKATGDKKDELGDQLELMEAQVELDEDEVDDARRDLIRAGGAPQDRIREMVQEQKAAAQSMRPVTAESAHVAGWGLIHRYQEWSSLHQKQLQLWRAKQAAEDAAAALSRQHDALDAKIDAEKLATPQLAHHSKKSKPGSPANPQAQLDLQDGALLEKTKQISFDQQALTTYDKRIDAHKELADTYGQWIAIVASRQRAEVRQALWGILIILAILLVGVYFSTLMEKLVSRLTMDRRQIQTLHTVTRVAVQVTAVLLILLVILGLPGQLGTFLGLAGAGLTVALKDFIVGFIGWLVLMGKNGIRLGDWVEINGVTGEVVEIGPFHTVLLETGNWTDSGHPTGRRVTFTNSFAIEGHYFNFSTSGQWLWDELTLVLASSQNPYPIVEAIQKTVLEATRESAGQAEQEWQHAARSRDMRALSAAPAINVKPVSGGVEIAVRYITRANERYQLRSKLYQAAMNLISKKDSLEPVSISEKEGPNLA